MQTILVSFNFVSNKIVFNLQIYHKTIKKGCKCLKCQKYLKTI